MLVLLAQIQLHILSQNTAAVSSVLSACTTLFAAGAQELQPQPLWSQLQLHFCLLRALVLLTEGRYAELTETGTLLVAGCCKLFLL